MGDVLKLERDPRVVAPCPGTDVTVTTVVDVMIGVIVVNEAN
jgi:hypothetical protein